ncbi:MAG: 2OG-Fe(II) oxygenase, partial [Candidatus Marinimicrobia bacterium]|nr:2OG-Fe(II) oxygenase [Candidatus Neomarinimicrobiota bacterium]
MIYTYKFENISQDDLNKINEIYDECDLSKGVMSPLRSGFDKKHNLEINTKDQYYALCTKIISKSIFSDPKFTRITQYESTSSLIFSEYLPGMYYKTHQDHHHMGKVRTDWSCTIFLNDPSEYEGGELVMNVGDIETSH